MSGYCNKCNAAIDLVHDKHYHCSRCGDTKILFCPDCTPGSNNCPGCGGGLDYHRESITRKAFHNPATRSLLGF